MSDEINSVKPLDLKIFKIQYPKLFPLWIAVFIDILGFTLIIPFLPFFIKELFIPIPELKPIFDLFPDSPTIALMVGIALSTNAVFGFFFGPILGHLSDKYGRRPFLLISQFGTLAAFVMLAFSNTYDLVIISRIIDGVFGGNFPIAKAMLGDVVPPKYRASQMTNIGVAHVLASLFGPAMGGFLFTRWGIIAPGLFAAFLSLITIIVTFLFLEESAPMARKSQLNKDIARDEDSIKNTPEEIRQKKRSIWKNKLALFLLVQWAFHTISFMVFMSNAALFADIQLNMTPDEIGLYLSLSGIARLIIRFYVFEPTLKNLGGKKTSQLGLICFVVAFFTIAFVQEFYQFILVLMLISFAAACTRGVLLSFQSRAVSPQEQGKMGGLSTSLDASAQIIGPLLGSFVLGTFGAIWFGFMATFIAIFAFFMSFRPIEFVHEAKPTQKPNFLAKNINSPSKH